MATPISAVEAGSIELPTQTLVDVQTGQALSAYEIERRARLQSAAEAYAAGRRFDRLSLIASTEAARADFAASRNQAYARAAMLRAGMGKGRVQ